MNAAVYPEEVAHLKSRFGEPLEVQLEIESDPEFLRAFRASLRRRRAEVAFLVLRPDRQVLVTTKAFYPSGVFRLPTGGVKPGEEVEKALWRELQEETGLQPQSARLGALIHYRMTTPGIAVRFATYLFVVSTEAGEPHCTDPDEEICEFREVAFTDLDLLANDLSHLGTGWRSWGLWRAVPHRVALQVLAGQSDTTPMPYVTGA